MSARHEEGSHRLTIDEIAAISTALSTALFPALIPALVEAFTDEADAFSLATFCSRHGISLQMYYKIAQQGLAPETFNIGTRVLVSKEAAARWRAAREGAVKAEGQPAKSISKQNDQAPETAV